MTQTSPFTFGRYSVESVLGRGSMGVVYRAWDPVIERPVAVKTLHLAEALGATDRREFLERFRREAKAAGGLSHPNIVVIYDFGEEDGQPYLAMELLEGRNLEQILETSGPFDPERALEILRQVASAIDHAHARGIVHRDLKPANLILGDTGTVKITDFGIAHLQSARLTRTGVSLGSPLYMAPEQVLGKPVDHRSDIFSLGSTAYEILAGVPAFGADNIAAIGFRIAYADPEPLRQRNAAVPPAWEDVLARAMAKDPAVRFPDAATLVRALEAGLDARGVVRAAGLAVAATVSLPAVVPRAEHAGPGGPGSGVADTRPVQTVAPTLVSPAPRRRRRFLPVLTTILVVGTAAGLSRLDFSPAWRPSAVAPRVTHLEEVAPPDPAAAPQPVEPDATSPVVLKGEDEADAEVETVPRVPPPVPETVPIAVEPASGEVRTASPKDSARDPADPRDAPLDVAAMTIEPAGETRITLRGTSTLRIAQVRVLLGDRVIWEQTVRARPRTAAGNVRIWRETFAGHVRVPAGDREFAIEFRDLETGAVYRHVTRRTLRAGKGRVLGFQLGPIDKRIEIDWD